MSKEELQKRIKEIYHKLDNDNLKMESYDVVPEDYCSDRIDYDTLLGKAVSDYYTAKQVRYLLSTLIDDIDDL